MRAIILAAFAVWAAPAAADVTAASDTGFVSTHSLTIAAPPVRVYTQLGKPALWWNKSHTYSGNARNLKMDLRAGGCFCEVIPDQRATIEHARVVYAQPGKALRLSGGLGPLQAEGVAAALTISIAPDGEGSRVTMTYVVGGYVRAGHKALAPAVDRVLGEQLAGLKQSVEGSGQ